MGKKGQIAVLFDMDGVLVDSEPVIAAAAMAGLKEYGVNAAHEDFLPFIGAGEDKYIGGVSEKHGVPYHLDMKKRVYEIYLDLVDENLTVYQGTRPLLERLTAAGFPIALASSADQVKIRANLRVAGIPTHTFGAVVGGEDVERKKPFPDIYLKAAEMLGADPAACVVVEDAVNGIRAAKAAGMRCIALTTSFSADVLQREEPDAICNAIEDIYDTLLQWSQDCV